MISSHYQPVNPGMNHLEEMRLILSIWPSVGQHRERMAQRASNNYGRSVMKSKRLMHAVSLMASVCATGVLAHQLTHQYDAASQRKPEGEKLGTVLFKTSCTPEAHGEFERALAMLHSFYFPETVKAFSAIPQTDPSCAIAYWGIAVSTRPNPLRLRATRRKPTPTCVAWRS
jgi:hypothetical protein